VVLSEDAWRISMSVPRLFDGHVRSEGRDRRDFTPPQGAADDGSQQSTDDLHGSPSIRSGLRRLTGGWPEINEVPAR